MFVGYARVSTIDQNLDMQIDCLKNVGCERIFEDKASGIKENRKGLEEALNFIRPGDTLVVWKIDRLGRSLKQLIEIVLNLKEKGIGFCSVTENFNTNTPGGELIFNIFGALAQFEREIIRERTRAGLSAARSRGKLGGRPKLLDDKMKQTALKLYEDKTLLVKDICNTLGISRATFYRYLNENKNLNNK